MRFCAISNRIRRVDAMGLIDVLLMIPLGWFAFKGFRNGFIREVTALLALVAGVWVASRFSWFIGGYIERGIGSSQQYVSVAAFALTFVGVLVLMHAAGRIATKMVQMIALGLANSLAGALFAFVKTAFIISVVIYIAGEFDPKGRLIKSEWRENSVLYGPVASVAPALLPAAAGSEVVVKDLFTSPEAP